eukprot:gene11143-11296_t
MPAGHEGAAALHQLLQQVQSAAPQLIIHLLRDGGQHLLLTQKPNRAIADAATLARLSHAVDEVRVEVPSVFCASIALAAPGCLDPVRVCLDSADHISSIDPWSASRHQVFKRISNLAVRAVAHFQVLQAAQRALEAGHAAAGSAGQRSAAAALHDDAAAAGSSDSNRRSTGLALECLLLWLASYDDLFSRPCAVSGKLIAWEPATAIPLPPILRPYW